MTRTIRSDEVEVITYTCEGCHREEVDPKARPLRNWHLSIQPTLCRFCKPGTIDRLIRYEQWREEW